MRVFGDIRRILAPFESEIPAPERVVRGAVALQPAITGQAKTAPRGGETHPGRIRRGTAQGRGIGLVRTRAIVGNIKCRDATERTRSRQHLVGRDVDRTVDVANVLIAIGYIRAGHMRVKLRGTEDKTRSQRSILVSVEADREGAANHGIRAEVDVVVGRFGRGGNIGQFEPVCEKSVQARLAHRRHPRHRGSEGARSAGPTDIGNGKLERLGFFGQLPSGKGHHAGRVEVLVERHSALRNRGLELPGSGGGRVADTGGKRDHKRSSFQAGRTERHILPREIDRVQRVGIRRRPGHRNTSPAGEVSAA